MKIARFLIKEGGKKKEKHGIVRNDKAIIDGAEYKLNELRFLPPVKPEKVICVGLNYIDHAKELKMKIPKEPIIFLKPPTTLIAHEEKIILPGQSKKVDYEAELAFVISKKCKNISRKKAKDYILGLTCFNDITARDLQRRDKQWTRAKSFDTFAPIGPWIVSIDEFNDLENLNLRIRLKKNKRTMQNSSTANLIFSIPYLLEFISKIMTLKKGDVIASGTPPGVGEMKEKDVVEVEIEKIGVLRNYAEREK